MNSLTEFLYPAPAPRRGLDIVEWWEKRRLPFNLIVGSAGLVSVGIIDLVSVIPPLGGQMPLIPWQPIVAFGILANIFYCLGPTAEFLIHRLWRGGILPTGPGLFRMGLTFSVGLALLPALLFPVMWVIAAIFTLL